MALINSSFRCLNSTVNDEDFKDDQIGEYNGCEVRRSRDLGRYVFATRPIKNGELILEEEALVVGPDLKEKPVCLGCTKIIDRSTPIHRCPRCYWQLCGSDCEGIGSELGHSKWECELLSSKRVGRIVEQWGEYDRRLAYEVVFILRCLLLKLFDEARWKKLSNLESNNAARVKIDNFSYEMRAIECIRSLWDIDLFTAEEIYTACGITDTNTFSITSSSLSGYAIYYRASIFAHACSPNAAFSFLEDGKSSTGIPLIQVHAIRDIQVGESVTIYYNSDTNAQTILQRRWHLFVSKFFWCSCSKCADPTEFGTFASALRCKSCSTGPVLPINSLDVASDWRCWHCSKQIDSQRVYRTVIRLQQKLDAIDKNDKKGYRKFLKKYRDILDERHYFMRQAQAALEALGCKTESKTNVS